MNYLFGGVFVWFFGFFSFCLSSGIDVSLDTVVLERDFDFIMEAPYYTINISIISDNTVLLLMLSKPISSKRPYY